MSKKRKQVLAPRPKSKPDPKHFEKQYTGVVPLFLEFLGASGVGKSTLAKLLLSRNALPSLNLFSLEHAFIVAKSPKIAASIMRSALFWKYLGKPILFPVFLRLHKIGQLNRIGSDLIQGSNTFAYHQAIEICANSIFNSSRSGDLRIRTFSFFLQTLHIHSTVKSSKNLTNRDLIVVDEGVLTNLRGLESQPMEVFASIHCIIPDIVVKCTASIETIARRYKAREYRQNRVFSEITLSTKKSIERFDKITSVLIKLESKLLYVNLEEISEELLEQLQKSLSETVETLTI